MLTIHPDIQANQITIPIHEWNIILEKLKEIEDIKVEVTKKLKGEGIFNKYANPKLTKNEKDAWAESASEKHENS